MIIIRDPHPFLAPAPMPMRSVRLLILLVLAAPLILAVPLSAQNAAPRLEVAVDVSHWQLDDLPGAGGDTRQTGTVRAAVLIPSRRPASLGVSATYAPGLMGFGSEFAQRVGAGGPRDTNLFVGVGAGVLRVADDEDDGAPCLPGEFGCIDETPDRPDDWRPVLSASLGVDVPFARGTLVQPAVQLVRPMGQNGSDGAFIRLGLGLAWRS